MSRAERLAARAARRNRRRTLVTPEGSALPIELASRGTRLGALAIDLTIIVLVMAFSTLAIGFGAAGLNEVSGGKIDKATGGLRTAFEFLVIVWIALMFLLRHGYFLYFELGPRGATPGKRMTGIRIAARNGGRLSPEMVLARNLLRDIELFLPLMLFVGARAGGSGLTGWLALLWFLLFALFPFFNRDRLRAGDLIAGTWVLEAARHKLAEAMSLGESAARGTSAATGATYRFGEAELAIYGEYELQTLERVLRENRPEAIAAVHEAICRKIGWDPGAGDERAFLDAYYTQLRARLEAGMRMGRRKADKHD
ncbi:MAG: RDD family protein [Novosphingobium sp.]|uniref:RDD family protein n=1 Tax=Novosphingobium sp. TaxID=1874826 RepID=UPI001E12F0F2|nr:RDD family protein [Novosphingobium sp.]MCB2058418.1 RDD family protein [Novosphingobium sp.]MCP5387262.1 RDD family protein [Novosphingobium sp.]